MGCAISAKAKSEQPIQITKKQQPHQQPDKKTQTNPNIIIATDNNHTSSQGHNISNTKALFKSFQAELVQVKKNDQSKAALKQREQQLKLSQHLSQQKQQKPYVVLLKQNNQNASIVKGKSGTANAKQSQNQNSLSEKGKQKQNSLQKPNTENHLPLEHNQHNNDNINNTHILPNQLPITTNIEGVQLLEHPKLENSSFVSKPSPRRVSQTRITQNNKQIAVSGDLPQNVQIPDVKHQTGLSEIQQYNFNEQFTGANSMSRRESVSDKPVGIKFGSNNYTSQAKGQHSWQRKIAQITEESELLQTQSLKLVEENKKDEEQSIKQNFNSLGKGIIQSKGRIKVQDDQQFIQKGSGKDGEYIEILKILKIDMESLQY